MDFTDEDRNTMELIERFMEEVFEKKVSKVLYDLIVKTRDEKSNQFTATLNKLIQKHHLNFKQIEYIREYVKNSFLWMFEYDFSKIGSIKRKNEDEDEDEVSIKRTRR